MLAKAYYYKVIEFVVNIFEDLNKSHGANAINHRGAKKLIELWHSHQCAVVTFNYDSLIERLVEQYLTPFLKDEIPIPNLYQIPIANVSSRSGATLYPDPKETFKLLKLHGSVNWHYAGTNNPAEPIYYTPINYSEEDRNRIEKDKRGLIPFIIPPLTDKSAQYFNIAIQEQWRLARKAIREAENVYIIGYSLPLTDLITKSMFLEALMGGNSKIFVITKQPDERLLKEMQHQYREIVENKDERFHFENVKDGSSVEWLASQF